jgi:hypothetical protein
LAWSLEGFSLLCAGWRCQCAWPPAECAFSLASGGHCEVSGQTDTCRSAGSFLGGRHFTQPHHGHRLRPRVDQLWPSRRSSRKPPPPCWPRPTRRSKACWPCSSKHRCARNTCRTSNGAKDAPTVGLNDWHAAAGDKSSGLFELSYLEAQRPPQFLLNVVGDQLLVLP